MQIIFNKNNAGASEMKELIGFIYKSINFNNLVTFIRFAQHDLLKMVGYELWNQALGHYHSANYNLAPTDPVNVQFAMLDALVNKIQLVVALDAYRRYVPSADLSHSDKGRQIFVSDQEKPAFEWMIEKDNDNLRTLAAEAMENLLEWLDENHATAGEGGTPYLAWAAGEALTQRKKLFINSAAAFDEIFPIRRSRLTFLALAPFIRRVQEMDIRSLFTAEKFTEIKLQFSTSDLSPENREIYDRIIQPLALLALSHAVKRLSSEVLPDGIFTHAISNVVNEKRSSSKVDRNEVSLSLEKDGMRELAKLQAYLRQLSVSQTGLIETSDLSDRIDETKLFVQL